jgi:hypothetical protein
LLLCSKFSCWPFIVKKTDGRLYAEKHRYSEKLRRVNKIWSIADEGLERSADSRASRVHFLRFELGGTNTTDASRDWLLNDLD